MPLPAVENTYRLEATGAKRKDGQPRAWYLIERGSKKDAAGNIIKRDIIPLKRKEGQDAPEERKQAYATNVARYADRANSSTTAGKDKGAGSPA